MSQPMLGVGLTTLEEKDAEEVLLLALRIVMYRVNDDLKKEAEETIKRIDRRVGQEKYGERLMRKMRPPGGRALPGEAVPSGVEEQ